MVNRFLANNLVRILHVVPSYFPAIRYGGPIYSVHGLCKALAALGHEVHVYTTNVDGPYDSAVPLLQAVDMDGVKIWYFPSKHLRRLYWAPAMGRFLQQRIAEFDIVHLHSVFLWPTWAAATAAQKANVPYVLSPRGMLVKDLIRRKSRWLKTAWIALIERRNIAGAALIHTTSEAERNDLGAFGFRFADSVVIPNGVEAPADWTGDAVSADVVAIIARQPLILFLGRVNWKKGLDRLLKAMPFISQGHLVIAGNDEEGYLPELRRIADEFGVTERIAFISRTVGGVDKEALFAAAKVFVLPSYSENFGNTVPEAMLRGCPVVVTEEVGAAEVVRIAQSGCVVAAERLPDAINALLNDQTTAASMGEQGREWANENLQWSRIAAALADAYRRILAAVIDNKAQGEGRKAK
jgi:glycosyltransferase involved in cell wall biosynthesis